MNNGKLIAWITPRCFVETDIYAIEALRNDYEIHWFIIDESNSLEYSEKILDLSNEGVIIEKLILPGRNRSLKVLKFYWTLLWKIRKGNYQLIYNAIFGMPFYMPLESFILPKDKTVIALHNVTTPKGAKSSSFLSKLYTYFVAHSFVNYHTFSNSQCEILRNIAKGKNVYNIPFFLKNYGTSHLRVPDEITFLFFGQILEYKRLDVLIQASENVYNKLNIPFKVKIAGSCSCWERYEKLISHKELFELTIRRISNEEIPDLFATSHYFMMPYQDIAQSGAVIVAINYQLPIIVSKLPAFEEYIKDGKNGFLMNPADVKDLEEIMMDVLKNHALIYPSLKKGIQMTKNSCFTDSVIRKKYIEEFNQIIENHG